MRCMLKRNLTMLSKNFGCADDQGQRQMDLYDGCNSEHNSIDEYKPGVTIQSCSSQGQMWRIKSRTTGRVCHLLSKLEYQVFLLLDIHPNIIEIKEQYSHDLPLSLKVAFELGVNHPPQNNQEKLPLTTDFVVTYQGVEAKQIGIYVKYAKDLNNYRTVEKLLLEKETLAKRNIPLLVITEKDIDTNALRNIEWFLTADASQYQLDDAKSRASNIYEQLQASSSEKLTQILARFDDENQMPAGTHLNELKCLLQLGFLHFDLNKEFHEFLGQDILFEAEL